MISIYGLYTADNSIFDQFHLPANVDKNELVTNLLLELGELEIIYPDPNVIKVSIEAWSFGMVRSWDMISEVLYKEYNPFINIQRDEIRTVTQESNVNNSGTNVNRVNAWNSTDPTTRDQNDTTGQQNATFTTTDKFHLEGDSAITDAQDVARKEIDLRVKYNLYNIITQDFKKRYCLMVY